MTRSVLITGATGFVGPYLSKFLIEQGDEVYGLYRQRADGRIPRRLKEKDLIGQVKLLEGDLTDITSLLSALDEADPDIVFHLGAQSYIPRSFADPMESIRVNTIGTQNLLEAMRLKESKATLVFAGSSEEYGLQIASESHYEWALRKYFCVFPKPRKIPELPIDENSDLRPMSPYAVSKVQGDFLVRNYFHAYGLKTVVSRAFNHEGAGRGDEFVTSTIVRQCLQLKLGEIKRILIGNINAFRDWSHVEDIIRGYALLAQKGEFGNVYVQGSMRTNSVLSYMLLTLEQLGYEISELRSVNGSKVVRLPCEPRDAQYWGIRLETTKLDDMFLKRELEFNAEDEGIVIRSNKGDIKVEFDKGRFRPADVPILISSTRKIDALGFRIGKTIRDIIRDQINYYLNPDNRQVE